MRYTLDITAEGSSRIQGCVQAEQWPRARSFSGWLELIGILEQIPPTEDTSRDREPGVGGSGAVASAHNAD